MGKLPKETGSSYLSESIIRGMYNPGPETYNPDASVIQPKRSSNISMRVPSRGLEKATWKHKKSDAPDCGSYEVAEAKTKVMRNTGSQSFSKKPIERFTTQEAKTKAYIPGTGTYDTDKASK